MSGKASRESSPDPDGLSRKQDPSDPREVMLYFEDFAPGATFTHPGLTVTRDEIVAFAREYDPQPFHLDEEAAKRSFLGELVASGWHTCALTMRMVADALILRSASMGAPGIDEVRWLAPVRPGDTLRTRIEVLDTRLPRSRPDRGFVHWRIEVANQRDEMVMTEVFWGMIGRRGAEPPAPPQRNAEEARTPPPPAPSASDALRPLPSFDDLAPGQTRELGTVSFPAEEIIRFARAFDPQPFHTDPEAARRSHFGGLCASGWHTASAWMKQMMADRERAREAALNRGMPEPQFGPSPGFKDLKWLKPVYAGDAISFRTTVVDKRPSASRPGWGLVTSHNAGDNQHGERVFEFMGAVFQARARTGET